MKVRELETLRLTTSRNVVLAAWRGVPTPQQLAMLEDEGARCEELYQNGTGLFSLIIAGVPNFSVAVHAATVQAHANPRIFRRGAVHAVLMTGLPGVAVRAYLSTAILQARNPVPTKVFGTIDAAARALSSRLDGGDVAWAQGELEALIARA